MPDKLTIKQGDHVYVDNGTEVEDTGCLLCGEPLEATKEACQGALEHLYTLRPIETEGDNDEVHS